MITSISIENFKGIGQRVKLPLKPITLLFGPNSAGKSTILHAIQYAYEVLENKNLNAGHTDFGGPFVDLGGFRNFVHNHDLSHAVTIGFEFQRDSTNDFLIEMIGDWQLNEDLVGRTLHRIGDVETATIELSIRWSPWRNRPYVAKYAVWLDGESVARIEADADKDGARLAGLNLRHPILSDSKESPDDIESDAVAYLWSEGLVTIPGDEGSRVLALLEPDALPELELDNQLIFARINEQDQGGPDSTGSLRTMQAGMNVLSAMLVGPAKVLRDERQTPQRNSEPPMSKEPGRWATGLAAWDVLKNGDDALINEVSFWLFRDECLNTGYAVKVRKLRELDEESPLMVQLQSERAFDNIDDLKAELERLPQRRRLVLIERRTTIDVDPEDVGEGIAQIVPVVVAVLSSTSGLIAIEQPELHVHPRVQVALGDLFIARVNKQRPRDVMSSMGIVPGTLLIETHSEHLLLRLLRRIRETTEGKLPHFAKPLRPAQLAVLYVEPGEGGTQIRELRVDETGEFLDPWPQGFFEERGEELFG
jgi:hypothetical protein